MPINLLVRQRVLSDEKSQEPTLLALALALAAAAALFLLIIVGIVGLPAFGHVPWTSAAVAGALAGLVVTFRRRTAPGPARTGRQCWLRRILAGTRLGLIALLAGWLGLLAWLLFGPGSPPPPPKADPAHVRVVSWNIHCGGDAGPPWKQFDWPSRKHALRAALEQSRPDILSVQEATPVQVAYLEQALPGHGRVGIGRDGARAGGEHCAVFFSRQRFEQLDGDTFWLEEPTDQPRQGSALSVKRICTWARLRDRLTHRTLRVYNAHLYLTEAPRREAARIILAHLAAGDPDDAVLLTADFNAGPGVPSRCRFLDAGLADSAERAGVPVGTPSFQLYGIGLWCIDGILVDHHWQVADHRLLRMKPNNVFPSDHFGLLSDLVLR